MTTYSNLVKTLTKYLHRPLRPHKMFIAGGALRDIDNGKVPKDIDIFVEAQEGELWDPLLNYIKAYDPDGFTHWRQLGVVAGEPHGEGYLVGLNGILGVWEADFVPDGVFEDGNEVITIQVIVYNRAFLDGVPGDNLYSKITSQFDLGICQIASKWDFETDKMILLKSSLYKQNKNSFGITRSRATDLQSPDQKVRTKERARRIAQKLNFVNLVEYPEDIARMELEHLVGGLMPNEVIYRRVNNNGLNQGWFNLPFGNR